MAKMAIVRRDNEDEVVDIEWKSKMKSLSVLVIVKAKSIAMLKSDVGVKVEVRCDVEVECWNRCCCRYRSSMSGSNYRVEVGKSLMSMSEVKN